MKSMKDPMGEQLGSAQTPALLQHRQNPKICTAQETKAGNQPRPCF